MTGEKELWKLIKYLNETKPETLRVHRKKGGCLEICRDSEEPPSQ